MDLDDAEDDIDGSIHSIHVKNFFCHENLEINLNRNVNFIVGRNGSGKSAILTALVVGLGSRASVTNRGSNLHSFIKKGANSASISIKIKNNSPRAYKHNIYGDYITIVRNINASGGSSYKVKSATGEVISTKFEEVNAVILAHDIQVDNPISVLNQDDTRSFHASDAKKKYSLYRKATNLDQTETNYVMALDNCNKANALLKKKIEASLELKKEYKKWKTIYELQSRDEIENQKKALQNEYYWSEIADLERNTNSIQSQYDKHKAKVEKLAEKLSKMEEHFGSQNGVIDVLKTQLDEKCLEKTALEQEWRDLESEVREVQVTSRSAQQSLAKHQMQYKREQRKVADLEREIHNIDSGSAASRRAQLEATASAAAAAAAAARARYETAQNDAHQARANDAHAQAHADQAAARAQNSRDSLRQLKQQLRELESRGNDSLAVYGNNMVELCQRVAQAVARGEFSAPPKGPVGAYIKVKEKKWGGALEHIIGGGPTDHMLKSFCVNSPEDSRKLFEIMGQVYGNAAKPSVTCSKFLSKQHDVRRNKVHAKGFLSALDAIDVSDPVVANFLIDRFAMERILLVPNHDDAVRLSDSEENVPNNCAKIVTLDSTEFRPAPNYRCYGGANRTSRFLLISTAERKRQLMSEIGEAQQTLQALEAQAEDLNQEVKRARDNERATSRALQALLAEKHDKDEAARVAAAAMLDQQQAPHHTVLVEELNIAKERLKTLKEQIDVYSKRDDGYRKKIDEYDIRMKRNKTQLGEVRTACRDLNEQMKLEQGVTEWRTYQQRVKEDKTKLVQVEAILEEKKAAIDLKVQQALTLCPRVEDPRDIAIVSNELKKIQLKLSTIRSDGLTKAQVGEQLLLVKNKYKKTKETLARVKLLIDNIRKTADEHLKFCRLVQSYIANRVQYCFQSILTLRGYSGSMNIDNGEGTLEIQCTGRESGERRHAASTSSLSGGERSYSTVAFIMALWDCVELPFYFMDEFDVFMDNVNRKIVMELLIDHALKNTNRQFVFLTPHDTSSVVASEQISIHLMANPRP